MQVNKKSVNYLKLLGKVSIHVKLMGIILILVILLGLWVSLQVQATLSKTLSEQLDQQGISVARDLAARSTDYIFTNNIFSLHELNKETIKNNNNVRYAFILDSSGRVLVHSFGKSLPKGLRDANLIKKGRKYNIKLINTDEGKIHDIAVPVFEGRAGIVHIGMSESGMYKIIEKTTEHIIQSTLVVSLLGILAAYGLTILVTRPILNMVEATKDISEGNLQRRVPLWWAMDEFRHLGQAFNNMLDSMENSRKENYRLWTELKTKEEIRIRLLDKVITAQEEERKRISRELHDQTSQSLTSLIIGLKAIENIENKDLLKAKTEELRVLVGQTLEELHDLALDLRPSALDDLGLEAALQKYTKDYTNKYGIEVDMHTNGLKNLRLPPQVETTIYRIVQEALTNIVKHAQAKNVGVIMERRDHTLVLIIEDDGKGFDTTGSRNVSLQKKRLGLFGMEERVSLLGGNLTIESEVGFGTTLFVNVPLQDGEI